MLTGDENIVDIDFVVFWRIKDASAVPVQHPEPRHHRQRGGRERHARGRRPVEDPADPDASAAEDRAGRAEPDAGRLDSYGAGIRIDQVQLQKVDPPAQVIDAFRDVQAARADKERLQNEAFGYANKVVPEARGEAERILQGAEGYKQQTSPRRTARRRASCKVYDQYKKAPDVTRKRMYPRDHGARARRHRQDHHRQQGAARASCPTCRSTSCSPKPAAREQTDARVSRPPDHYRRPRRRIHLCLGVHRAPERAGARACASANQSASCASRVSTGSTRSSTRSKFTTSASSTSTASRRR